MKELTVLIGKEIPEEMEEKVFSMEAKFYVIEWGDGEEEYIPLN